MQIVEFAAGTLRFLDAVPQEAPKDGFVWIYLDREALASQMPQLQEAAQRLGGSTVLDLHLQDLQNAAHPSHYDYTSVYDLVVFRRLATADEADADLLADNEPAATSTALATFHRIRTRAVAFVVFDRLLITVHPESCLTARAFIGRYLSDAVQTNGQVVVSRSRLPLRPKLHPSGWPVCMLETMRRLAPRPSVRIHAPTVKSSVSAPIDASCGTESPSSTPSKRSAWPLGPVMPCCGH